MRIGVLAGIALGLGWSACGDDETTTADTRDTAVAAETTPDAAAETTPDAAAETTPETTPSGATWDDVYPIFTASCRPCHQSNSPSGGPEGGHSIASSDKAVAYQASQRDAMFFKCSGKKIGECALIRIQDGSMPQTGACQEPVTAQCPDSDEQATIQAWIDAGMPEN